jgi:coproporphyrinogen III oxidase-like Fe-S oxidoreductase
MLVACRFGLSLVVFLRLVCTGVTAFVASPAESIDRSTRRAVFGCAAYAPKYDVENEVAALSSKEERQPSIGLYVHIPYCRRRCRYCNFAIVPIGCNVETDVRDEFDDQQLQSVGFHRMNQEYTAALLKELQSIQAQRGLREEKICLQSVYFGGGTPSLMPIESLQQVMMAIFDEFQLETNCEITLEVDPGTFTVEKLRAWKELGVNRLSLGVQSFDDILLESLGRVHRLKDIYDAVVMIRDVYGEDVNYSIDLISGLPGLSIALWMETLQIATTGLNPRPNHLSVYDLQIEQVRRWIFLESL